MIRSRWYWMVWGVSVWSLATCSLSLWAKEKPSTQTSPTSFLYKGTVLPIPPLLNFKKVKGEKRFTLRAQNGTHRFGKGLTSTSMGYNGAGYLGPTIRVAKGDKVAITLVNDIRGEGTTVHWHGLSVRGGADGNMHQPIKSGESWKASFKVHQDAATLWYHPHFYHNTARQAYLGLAGFFIVDDATSTKRSLPNTYGVDDIPLVIQDHVFDKDGQQIYRLGHGSRMHGYIGHTLLTNGVTRAHMDIKRKLMRFRVLNGSNARSIICVSVQKDRRDLSASLSLRAMVAFWRSQWLKRCSPSPPVSAMKS